MVSVLWCIYRCQLNIIDWLAEQFQLLCRVRDDKNGNGGMYSDVFVSNLKTSSAMLCISFWHYFISVTNSPVSLLLNSCFFFSSFLFWGEIFLSARWGFFFSAAQFVSLPLRLCALVSFRHLYLQINQTKKHLCLNEASSFYPPLCAASWFGVFVRADGQEVAELWRWKRIQATWRRRHWSLSPLCLSLSRPVRPSVRAPSKGRLSRHKGHSERTHTHTHMKTERNTPSSDWTNGHWVRHFRTTLIASYNESKGLCF